jgi:folate-binding protein YgfZ
MAGMPTDTLGGTRPRHPMPSGEPPADEYRALIEGCGLLDRSERGKLALTGPGAIEFLNGQVTNELSSLPPGSGCYAAFLTHKGKMLGDLRILAVGDGGDAPATELLLDTERVALQPLFDMIRRFKVGYDVELHKRTLERGLLSLIGPHAAAIAGVELSGAESSSAERAQTSRLADVEQAHTLLEIGAISALAVRTDVGVDLICDAADTGGLSAALRARGAVAVGEQTAECLRIERGRPRYGVDLDDSVIPQEAGLNERAVSFTKGCYVGQETVARLYYKGKPNRHLRGLRLSEPVTCGEPLALPLQGGCVERAVGRVGSVALSPTFGPIALALARREATPGAVVSVGQGGVEAEVVELPFRGD